MKKKIVLTLSLALLLATSIRAQIDSTRTKPRTGTQPTLQQPTPPQTAPPAQQSDYLKENRTMIHPEDLPATLRENLRGNQYRGWENSTIYQDKTTGEYSLDIKNGNNPMKTYRFDRNGRPIADPAGQNPARDQHQ